MKLLEYNSKLFLNDAVLRGSFSRNVGLLLTSCKVLHKTLKTLENAILSLVQFHGLKAKTQP